MKPAATSPRVTRMAPSLSAADSPSRPPSGNIDNNATTYFSRPYYAGYLQDDWKITDRLTLSLGARYEIQVAYLERYNRQGSQFDISVKNPLSDQILAVWNADKAAYDANPGAHLTAAGNFY